MKLADAVHEVEHRALAREEARSLFGAILEKPPPEDELAALLRALAARGESADEIAGAAEAMRAAMVVFEHGERAAIDSCGTGGDGLATFNLSTAAALVAAAAGARVVKHGNQAASSRCGSADLLEAAGVPLALEPAAAREVFEECGFVFLFAPAYHPALAALAPVRRALGIRTIFNLLGPLCNPGRVRRQLLGVGDARRVDDVARVLASLGCERGAVVHGASGADELTLDGANQVRWIDALTACVPQGLDAARCGLTAAPIDALAGGDVARNLALLKGVLDGARGPLRDAVLLNAAVVIHLAGPDGELERGLELALGRAAAALDSGAAKRLLERVVERSRRARRGSR